jgi:hypothetical protein
LSQQKYPASGGAKNEGKRQKNRVEKSHKVGGAQQTSTQDRATADKQAIFKPM